MIHILRYLFILAAVTVLAAGTAALLARCAGREALCLGGYSLPLRWGRAAHGEPFTRSMALRAALWAGVYLAALYAVTALYCAVGRRPLPEPGGAGLPRLHREWPTSFPRVLSTLPLDCAGSARTSRQL